MFQIHTGKEIEKTGNRGIQENHTELRLASDCSFPISFPQIKRDSWISAVLGAGNKNKAYSELSNQAPELMNPLRIPTEKKKTLQCS